MNWKNKRVLNTKNILIFLLLLNMKSTVSSLDKDGYTEATTIAAITLSTFASMFLECSANPMPGLQFEIDDLKKFVNYPSKTTVGFAPKFTSNRKFFANLISTNAFKDMLQKDKDKIEKSLIAKLKYCQSATVDRSLLADFYDREVDPNKI